jgi:hypothetical protein
LWDLGGTGSFSSTSASATSIGEFGIGWGGTSIEDRDLEVRDLTDRFGVASAGGLRRDAGIGVFVTTSAATAFALRFEAPE